MRDKTVIGFVAGAVNSELVAALTQRLEVECPGEFEVIEISAEHTPACHPFDQVIPTIRELDRQLNGLTRQPFRLMYKDRIDRYNRVWPRYGCPMLTWNRNSKWLPRFYDTPRKLYFSQSQLRRSQVMSQHRISICSRHTVCSLEDLDLSRWPSP